jgi:hypothetical protein
LSYFSQPAGRSPASHQAAKPQRSGSISSTLDYFLCSSLELLQQTHSATDSLGNQTHSATDSLGTDLLGNQTHSATDSLGNQTHSATDSLGNQTHSATDSLGNRLTRQQTHSATRLTRQQTHSATDSLGNQTHSATDSLGNRLTRQQTHSATDLLGNRLTRQRLCRPMCGGAMPRRRRSKKSLGYALRSAFGPFTPHRSRRLSVGGHYISSCKVFSCRISKLRAPAGVRTTTSSPSCLPIRLRPTGEVVEISPWAGSLSSGVTRR